jgi:hypothetical protein
MRATKAVVRATCYAFGGTKKCSACSGRGSVGAGCPRYPVRRH